MARRVVITGIGTLNPLALNIEDYWNSLVQGKCGIGKITHFDASSYASQIAGEVKGFNPKDFIDRKQTKRMDAFVQFAVAAARMALENSKLDLAKEDATRFGVVTGSGIGGLRTLERQHTILLERGSDRLSPFFIPMMIADMSAGFISMLYGLKGPNYGTISACASSAHAIGDSYEIIKNGMADIMVAGGSEAAITPLGVGGFCAARALSLCNDEPHKASRPFDKGRDGFVIGEGAGMLILEELEHAKSRNAKIYAEIIGWGMTADAHHLTAPAPGGEGAARAMKMALKYASLQPEDIDYINAHGTSTLLNDKFETMAIKSVFKEHAYKLLISSTKSMIGHLLGASAAAELIAICLMIENNKIHPTINYENPDPDCDLNYVPNEAVEHKIQAALSNSFGFGGHNVSLAIGRFVE